MKSYFFPLVTKWAFFKAWSGKKIIIRFPLYVIKKIEKTKYKNFILFIFFSIILFAGKILEWTQLRRTDWRGFNPQTIEFWWRLQQIYRFIVWRNIGSGSKHRKTSKNKTQSSPINRKYHWFSYIRTIIILPNYQTIHVFGSYNARMIVSISRKK